MTSHPRTAPPWSLQALIATEIAKSSSPAVMPAGSVMIYSGRLLHGAGGNTTDTTRLGLIVEHVARWLRPAECHPLAVGTDIAATLTPELQELLGFNQTSDYFGFINGKPPAQWLQARSGRADRCNNAGPRPSAEQETLPRSGVAVQAPTL